MANFTDPDRFTRAAANPAAPKGLRQTATRLEEQRTGFDPTSGALAPWMPKDSMLETAQQWYGGANTEGIDNGWNTEFYRSAFSQRDEYLNRAARGEQDQQTGAWYSKPSTFYDWLDTSKNQNATGVAIWDDPNKGIEFGDVFNGGKKVGNLYTDYDEATADVMVGEFLFTNDQKQRMMDPRSPGAQDTRTQYRAAVEQARKENSEKAQYAVSAEQYQEEVRQTERAWHEGAGNEATVLASGVATGAMTAAGAGLVTAGSAAAAAALGFSWTGPGALLAAGIAGGVGFVGGTIAGYLNQDQLVEQASRAWVTTDRANAKYGAIQTAATAAEEFSGVGMKLIAPVANLVEGVNDARLGEVGDATAEFYELDENGERRVGGVAKGLHLGATLTDSLLQFASPIGRWLYMGTMGATVAGGGVGLFKGAAFNDRKGEFDSFDTWQEGAAAAGSWGIDAVQLGTAGLLGSATAKMRNAVGQEAKEDVEEGALARLGDRMRPGFGEGAARFETVNGVRFAIDDTGRAIQKRYTMEMLAPSEFMRWMPTTWVERMKRLDGGELSVDNLYMSALNLSSSGSRFRDAVVVGYAEAWEEGIQAYLEPLKFSESASFDEVRTAALYGAASGMGMSLGAINRRPANAAVEEKRARALYTMRTGEDPTDEEWKAKVWDRATPAERSRMAIANADESRQIQGILQTYAQQHKTNTAYQSAIGIAAANDLKLTAWEAGLKKALQDGNGSLVLMGQGTDTVISPKGGIEKKKYEAHAAVFSAWEGLNQVHLINEGLVAQENQRMADLRDAEAMLAAANEAGNSEGAAHAQELIAEATQREAVLKMQKLVSDEVVSALDSVYGRFQDETDEARQIALLEQMNQLLRKAYEGQWKSRVQGLSPADAAQLAKRSVEFKMGRHPYMDRGSFAMMMPQVSVELTKEGAHGTVYLHQATLKVLGADHDGDTAVPLHEIYLSPDEINQLRRGTNYLAPVGSKERKPGEDNPTSLQIVSDPPDDEMVYLRMFSDALNDPTSLMAKAVNGEVNLLITDFHKRYNTVLDPNALSQALTDFKNGLIGANPDSRVTLVNTLFNMNPQGLFEMSDTTHMPEALWMMGRINTAWDRIQKEFAHKEEINRRSVPVGDHTRVPADNAYQTKVARRDAQHAGINLSMLGASDSVRAGQYLHYSALYRSAVEVSRLNGNNLSPDLQFQLTKEYANLGSGVTMSELDLVTGRNAIEDRVLQWLTRMANSVEGTTEATPEVLMLLANTEVQDMRVVGPNAYEFTEGKITMLQLLLRRSLEIEENLQAKADPDSDILRKIKTLKRLTFAEGKHSTTAALATLEVFGSYQLHQLLGNSSLYLSPQMTLDQLKMQLGGMHERSRQDFLYDLQRSPAYFKGHGKGDAPWPEQTLTDGSVNAFTMLVDALSTGTYTAKKNREDRDATAHKNFIKGLKQLHATLDAWRVTHEGRLRGAGVLEDKVLLRDLLENRPEIASLIADLIPKASRPGVFEVIDGRVYTAEWVEDMLVNRDTDRAAVDYFINLKLAEFNAMGGLLTREDDGEVVSETYEVKYGRIKSRFLQVLHELASEPTGFELARLLKAADEAPNLETFFEKLNGEPRWRGHREELLPYHDDVALFEVDPKDVWNPGLAGSEQRENITSWGERMKVFGSMAVEAATNHKVNLQLLTAMNAELRAREAGTTGPNDVNAREYLDLLEKAIRNRRLFPDTQGQAAREQLMELIQGGLAITHNKGAADDMAAPWGEPYITLDGFGYKNGVMQELDALTALDLEDVKTNLTKLVDGPVRIMMPNGAIMRIDMSDTKQALKMLADPRTQGFAMAVLFPSVRDVNNQNVVQSYLDIDDTASLPKMLSDQNFAYLFRERSDMTEKVRQAHRYLGMIEAYARKKAMQLDNREDRDAAFAPIQNLLNDLLTAYTHAPTAGGRSAERVRDDLVVKAADAIKAVAAVNPQNRQMLKDMLDSQMRERFERGAGDMPMDSDLNNFITETYRTRMIEYYTRRIEDLQTEFEQEQDPAKKQDLQTQMDLLLADADALADTSTVTLPNSLYMNVSSVVNMYKMSGDPVVDGPRKAEIIRMLSKRNRSTVFEDKKTMDLAARLRAVIHRDPAEALDPDVFDEKEWNTLGSWVATVYVSDLTSRSASSVTSLAMGEEGNEIRRYFDVSWSYLSDPLFDEIVLEAADLLAQQAQFSTTVQVLDAAKIIERGILNPDLLGVWTDRIPMESMKARKIIRSAPVGAAIAANGNAPKELADYVGSGWVSFRQPEAAHHTKVILPGSAGQDVIEMLGGEQALLKLHNHFADRMMLIPNDGSAPIDLLPEVATKNMSDSSVTNSDYWVLNLHTLQQKLPALLASRGITDFTLDIQYVDSSKKPHKREWANNIYFDGVGREYLSGAGGGPVASLIFGLDAVSKQGQQNPLDMAAKAGQGFMQHRTTDLGTVITMEPAGATVEEILGRKAMHMIAQNYETGALFDDDLPAVLKLMKMRHLFVGYDANGVKQVWWPEQAIAYQADGQNPPLANMQLIAISDAVAQTLLGGAGHMGVKGDMQRPVLNLQDMDPFPSLDPTRLKELGLTQLGETVDAELSGLAQITKPPKSMITADRGKNMRTVYQQRILQWQGQAQTVTSNRMLRRNQGGGEGTFDIRAINKENANTLSKFLSPENAGRIFQNMGVPYSSMTDLAAVRANVTLASQIDRFMESSNNLIWHYKQDAGVDLSTGTIGLSALNDGFTAIEKYAPVYGDVVIVDLGSIMAANGNRYEPSLEQAQRVISQLSKRGVTIALASEWGHQDLRMAVSGWINEGSLDYRGISKSNAIFSPIKEDPTTSAIRDSLESTLTEVDQITARGVGLALVADAASTGLSENTVYIDTEHDETWNRVSHTIIPTSIMTMGTGRDSRRYAFGVPVKGTGALDQYAQVSAKLLPLLRSDEGRKHLGKLASGGKGDGNPKNGRLFKRNKNGMNDPGILSMEDALNELKDVLESTGFPTDPGRTLQTGSIIPLLAADGSILLTRVGFQLPDAMQMSKQLRSPSDDVKPVKGKKSLGIAIATDKIDAKQTVPPPFVIDSVRPDRRGISVLGHYPLGSMAKMVSEGVGFKAGFTSMPNNMKFTDLDLALNGLRVTQVMSRQSVVGKQATRGFVDNFRNLFAVTGVDFREDLIDVFLGKSAQPRSDQEVDQAWGVLQPMLEMWAEMDFGMSAADLDRALDADTFASAYSSELNTIGSQLIQNFQPIDLRQDPAQAVDPQKRLASIILATLAAPNVKLEHVISTSGLMTVTSRDSDAQITMFPPMMTDAMNDMAYPELREMLFARANGMMPKDQTTQELEYFFDTAFNFYVRTYNEVKGRYEMQKGTLNIHLPVAADENHVSLTQASIGGSASASPHIARTVGEAIGGRTSVKQKVLKGKKGEPDTIVETPSSLDELYGVNEIYRFDDASGAAFWDMLTRVQTRDRSYSPWERYLPMEEIHLARGAVKVAAHTTVIDKSEWKDRNRAETKADELLKKLNLHRLGVQERDEVDFLVRQFMGRPGPVPGQEEFEDDITADVYVQAVDLMLANMKDGMHPLHGAAVPLEHAAFWRKVYDANKNLPKGVRWAPRAKDGKVKKDAEGWDQWVDALVGQMLDSNEDFHTMFRNDLDGFWHTYQGVTAGFQNLQLSTDKLIALKLMDPDTQRVFLSIDPGKDALLRDPVLVDSMNVTYDALVGHTTTTRREDARTTPISDLADQIDRQKAWLKGQKIAPQKQTSVKEYAQQGAFYQESTRKTTNFFRGVTNLSITTRLANPALYVSAYLEVPFRNFHEHAANILSGSHIGAGGKTISNVGKTLGIETQFTAEEIEMLNNLALQLGESNVFLGELFGEMTYQRFVQAGGQSKVGQFLERTAQMTAKTTSDPRWGMRNTSVAKRYLEAAWEYLSLTDSQVTVEQFVQLMKENPLWLKEISPEGRFSAHRSGMNRVAQVRSTKATVGSKMLMGGIDSLTDSSSVGLNAAGHVLKIPFMFTRFNINAFVTLAGLGGLDQTTAMFFDRRKRPDIINRIAATVEGKSFEEMREYSDMSDIIESVDLTRAYVRGAFTHTTLMQLGMMAGNLGLGGEDDEERRRRRLAEYLNIPHYYDPREAYNDFRWADAIFLDNIPWLKNVYKNETGHAAVVPHWILKQFLSPVMGMVRFFETGDVREIGYGFWDAASVLPNSVLGLYKEADLTAKLLAEAAKDDDLGEVAEAQARKSQMLVNIVGVYEKALFENAFVNALRNGKDEFDRNPWATPMIDEASGNIMKQDGSGLPMRTEALSGFQQEASLGAGETNRVGYATRTGDDALLHQYAENNATFALVGSLFTGLGNSSLLRRNMVVKTKDVNVDETTKDEAEELILSAFEGAGGQLKLTKEELFKKLKFQAEAAGQWWDQSEIEASADAIWAANNDSDYVLSSLDSNGQELITKAGGEGIYKSLKDGIINFNSPVLANVSISQEMRDEIAEEWVTELIQEGIDLGLNEEAAMYRARRFWYGDSMDPSIPSLRALLYDKRIADKPTATYNQLNTTYVLGPDGRPWATPFERPSPMAAVLPLPQQIVRPAEGMGLDQRGNSVDLMRKINTGLAGLAPQLVDSTIEATDEPFNKAVAKDYTTSQTPYGKRSYGGYGGGGGYGGYSSGGSAYFQKMQQLPRGTSARIDGLPMINTNTPYVRRAEIRRERITSERGRLKQWQ